MVIWYIFLIEWFICTQAYRHGTTSIVVPQQYPFSSPCTVIVAPVCWPRVNILYLPLVVSLGLCSRHTRLHVSGQGKHYIFFFFFCSNQTLKLCRYSREYTRDFLTSAFWPLTNALHVYTMSTQLLYNKLGWTSTNLNKIRTNKYVEITLRYGVEDWDMLRPPESPAIWRLCTLERVVH